MTMRSSAPKFETHRRRNLSLAVAPGFSVDAALQAMALHRDAVFLGNDDLIKVDRKTALSRVRPPADSSAVVVKQYRFHGAPVACAERLRVSRGLRAATAALRLLKMGVRVPRPLAFVERRGWGMIIESLVVMEDLSAEFVELDRCLAAEIAGPVAKGTRRLERLATSLASELRGQHRAGIVHGDLKTCNVFAHRADSRRGRGSATMAFCDLDDVTFDAQPTRGKIVSALAQLHRSTPRAVPRRVRALFLRRYLGRRGPLTRADLALAARVDRVARQAPVLYVGPAGDVCQPWEE